MTMVDGWVVEKISDDPAVLPFSGGGSATAVLEAPKNEKPKKQKKEKKKKKEKPAKSVAEVAVATPVPETVERFKPIEIVDPALDLTNQESAEEKESKAGKFIGTAIGVAVLAAGAFFAWPYIASLLEPAEVAVFTPTIPVDQTPTQRYVIDGDNMYLEGSVPNEDVSDAIQGAASEALGDDRVINNFEISDDAVFDPSAPVQLTVAETVQFGTGNAEIAAQYAPLIDLAVELMTTQPSVTLTIIGHTDSRGDEETNLRLSIERAQSTANQLVARGIDRDRLTIDGRGESEPIASNEEEAGRAANRRVEFLVAGLLG